MKAFSYLQEFRQNIKYYIIASILYTTGTTLFPLLISEQCKDNVWEEYIYYLISNTVIGLGVSFFLSFVTRNIKFNRFSDKQRKISSLVGLIIMITVFIVTFYLNYQC